ncbi:MAG: lysylphosphatidylglycerol synthase transmembrane domain-containing protein [Candidatus Bathyarchaeales archaeon]
MSFNKKNIIRIGVSLVIGVFLLIVLLWWTGIDKIIEQISSASPLWLVVSALVIVPAYAVKALRWKLLLKPVKNGTHVSNAFWSTALGSMVNTLIPIRIGEFARAYVLGEKEKTGFAPAFSSIIVERTLDLIGLLTIGVATMLIVSTQTSLDQLVANIFTAVALLIIAILAVIVVGTKKEAAIIKIVMQVTSKIPFVKKYSARIAEFASSLIKGLQGLSQNPRMLAVNFSLTWAAWLVHTSAIYFVFMAFNYPISIAAATLGGTLMSLSHILPATPGYVGSYEAFWVLIFTMLGVTKMDMLLSIGLISHIIGTLPVVAVGCISVIWLGVSFEEIFSFKKNNETHNTEHGNIEANRRKPQ